MLSEKINNEIKSLIYDASQSQSYATLYTHDPHPSNRRQKEKKKIQEHLNYFHHLVTIPHALDTLLSSNERNSYNHLKGFYFLITHISVK